MVFLSFLSLPDILQCSVYEPQYFPLVFSVQRVLLGVADIKHYIFMNLLWELYKNNCKCKIGENSSFEIQVREAFLQFKLILTFSSYYCNSALFVYFKVFHIEISSKYDYRTCIYWCLIICFISSSVFALHSTEPPISAQLLAFLRVFCMSEGKMFYKDNIIYVCFGGWLVHCLGFWLVWFFVCLLFGWFVIFLLLFVVQERGWHLYNIKLENQKSWGA